MPESNSLLPSRPDPAIRKLKIEADGDPYKSAIKPKMRITGRWLERAGFKPGTHVHVTCVAPGLIELRAPDPGPLNEGLPSKEP
ncbi:MAG: SymE family type I addiction module toxin [Armatimonadota bacterium]